MLGYPLFSFKYFTVCHPKIPVTSAATTISPYRKTFPVSYWMESQKNQFV